MQDYFHSWLEKELALQIVGDSRYNSVKVLKLLIEKTEMLHSFYGHLIENIPNNWVLNKKQEWVNINVSPDKLIDSMRMSGKEYFDNYINSFQQYSKENIWNYVQKVTEYSDYIMLNSEYSFISSVLIEKEHFLFGLNFGTI